MTVLVNGMKVGPNERADCTRLNEVSTTLVATGMKIRV